MNQMILTDAAGARTIGSLIDAAGDESGNPLESRRTLPQHAIVVRLLSSISAGSVAQVDAEIMALDGANWVGTKQVVKVRNITGTAVSTTGRRIARRVGRWGWCVIET